MSRAVKVVFDTPYCGTDEISYYIFGDNDEFFMKEFVEEDFDTYRNDNDYLAADNYCDYDPENDDYESSVDAFYESTEYEEYLDGCSCTIEPIEIKDIPKDANIKNLEEMFG